MEKVVGQRIREARERAGMTQITLAGMAGISQSELSRIESGHRSLSVDRLTLIARHLGMSPAVFLDDKLAA